MFRRISADHSCARVIDVLPGKIAGVGDCYRALRGSGDHDGLMAGGEPGSPNAMKIRAVVRLQHIYLELKQVIATDQSLVSLLTRNN